MSQYSFITPRERPVLSLFAKVWIAFFVLGLSCIILIYVIGLGKVYVQNTTIAKAKTELELIEQRTVETDRTFNILLDQAIVSNAFEKNNVYLRNSLKNFLDLVIKSGAITLESLEQGKDSLKITGTTPTRELFALLIETTLKSIFDESHTSYYPLDNGLYKFVNASRKIQELE